MRALFISTFVSGPKMITFVSFIILISTSTVSSFSPQAVFFMIGKYLHITISKLNDFQKFKFLLVYLVIQDQTIDFN